MKSILELRFVSKGMMIGGSCGSAMWGVHKYIKDQGLGKGDRVVVKLKLFQNHFLFSTSNYVSSTCKIEK